MIPDCFAPSRRFTPFPWRGRRPPRLPKLPHPVRLVIGGILLLAVAALMALPATIVAFVYSLFHARW